MQQPLRTSSADSAADGIRKRVCKACDRCRLKKSKCDGSSPCSRCKADNAICVFGERKKSHDKVYPKGYVEMLEQQQGQLVSGLQEMYRRALKGNTWHTAPLAESNGNPLTHDLLAALDLLESKHDGSNEKEEFEENLSKLQQRLYDRGAGVMRRRASVSSESDQSHLGLAVSTPQDTPILNKPPIFKEEWGFSASPSPIAQSPLPRQRQSYPSAQQLPNHHQPSPLTQDPHIYQPDWTLNNINNPGAMMASRFAMQTPRVQHTLNDVEEMMINNSQMGLYEQSMSEFNAFSQDPSQFASPFGGYQGYQPDHYPIPLDERDLDFNNFLKVEA